MEKITLNVNQWDYIDYVQFRETFLTGRFVSALIKALPIVAHWDYADGEISDTAVKQLPTTTIFEITQTIMDQIGAVITEVNYDEVTIDLDGWVGMDYDEFVELGGKNALTAAEARRLENLLRAVANFEDGFELNEGLTAVEGWKISRAIAPEIDRFFQGNKRRGRRGNLSSSKIRPISE